MVGTSDAARSPWRWGVPVVCLLAGLLLAATHGVSGGTEIRSSDSPRLVDMVREAQAGVERLNAQRDALAGQIDNTHGRSSNLALAAMQARALARSQALPRWSDTQEGFAEALRALSA